MPNFKSNPSADSYLRLDPKYPEIDSTIKRSPHPYLDQGALSSFAERIKTIIFNDLKIINSHIMKVYNSHEFNN